MLHHCGKALREKSSVLLTRVEKACVKPCGCARGRVKIHTLDQRRLSRVERRCHCALHVSKIPTGFRADAVDLRVEDSPPVLAARLRAAKLWALGHTRGLPLTVGARKIVVRRHSRLPHFLEGQ